MMKQPCEGPKNPTYLIHQVADQRRSQNYHPFASHKMIEEESQEVGDFPEVEDFQEEEDSPEEVGIQAVAEYHQEDHPEEDGGHHRSPCLKPNKAN